MKYKVTFSLPDQTIEVEADDEHDAWEQAINELEQTQMVDVLLRADSEVERC